MATAPDQAPATAAARYVGSSILWPAFFIAAQLIVINLDVTPQGRPVKDGEMEVWSRKLSDGSMAIALYNEDDHGKNIGIKDFKVLGCAATTRARVRNLRMRVDESLVKGSLPLRLVEPHGTVLLRQTRLQSKVAILEIVQ